MGHYGGTTAQDGLRHTVAGIKPVKATHTTPRRGRKRRHVHVENLPAGVMDHEEHVQRSKRDGLNTEEVARPDFRRMLPQE